jgi:hypothetical protein
MLVNEGAMRCIGPNLLDLKQVQSPSLCRMPETALVVAFIKVEADVCVDLQVRVSAVRGV